MISIRHYHHYMKIQVEKEIFRESEKVQDDALLRNEDQEEKKEDEEVVWRWVRRIN